MEYINEWVWLVCFSSFTFWLGYMLSGNTTPLAKQIVLSVQKKWFKFIMKRNGWKPNSEAVPNFLEFFPNAKYTIRLYAEKYNGKAELTLNRNMDWHSIQKIKKIKLRSHKDVNRIVGSIRNLYEHNSVNYIRGENE